MNATPPKIGILGGAGVAAGIHVLQECTKTLRGPELNEFPDAHYPDVILDNASWPTFTADGTSTEHLAEMWASRISALRMIGCDLILPACNTMCQLFSSDACLVDIVAPLRTLSPEATVLGSTALLQALNLPLPSFQDQVTLIIDDIARQKLSIFQAAEDITSLLPEEASTVWIACTEISMTTAHLRRLLPFTSFNDTLELAVQYIHQHFFNNEAK